MIIKRITLRNIRSYANESMTFPEGITLLSGDIGTGKTTILLGIEFALFGILKGEVSGDILLRHGASNGFVELEMEVEKKEITIRRTLKKTGDFVAQSIGYIIIDGQKEELSADELKAKILDILGYPKQMLRQSKNFLFRYTIYTPQEEMKRILYEDNDTRMSMLRRIFQIDKYKTVRENSSVAVSSLKQKIKHSLEDLKTYDSLIEESDALNRSIREINSVLLMKKKDEEKAKSEILIIEKRKDTIEKQIEELRNKKNAMNLLEKEISFLEREDEKIRIILKDNKDKAEKIKEEFNAIKVDSSKQNEKELQIGIDSVNSEINKMQKIISEGKEKLKNAIKRSNELNSEISDLDKRYKILESIQKEIETIDKEIEKKAVAEENLKTAKEEYDAIRQAKTQKMLEMQSIKKNIELTKKDKCPVCLQEITSEYRKKIETEENNKIEKIKADIIVSDEKLLSSEKMISRINEQISLAKETQNKQMMLYAKLEQKNDIENNIRQKTMLLRQNDDEKKSANRILGDTDENMIKSLQEQLKLLNNTLLEARMNEERKARKEKLKGEFDETKRICENNKEALSLNLTSLEKRKEELSRTLKETEKTRAIESEYEQVKEELKNANQCEREVSGQIISLNSKIENMKENLKNLVLRIKEMEQKKQETQKKEKLKSWIEEFFIPLTEEIEKNVMLTIYYEFNELFINWFGMLINDENLQTRLDENFTPVIIQNGFETGIDGLSGGEKTSLALAYRLALNKVINDIITNIKTRDLIILDEPTDGFSSEQLDNVRKVLEELNVKQTIIVSHESKVESFAEHVINISKENNESRIN